MNELLSICIPTYDRAGYLQRSLDKIIPQAKQYDIPIYISDNASPDNTEKVVAAFAREYPNLFYSKNSKNQGGVVNVARVLHMSKTKYSWLLGDDDRITKNAIGEMITVLESADYDMVVVNGGKKLNSLAERVEGRVNDLKNFSLYSDRNKLLSDLGWHMTWISCLIFNSKIIKNGEFEKFFNTEIPHFAVIFNYLSRSNILVAWEPKAFVYSSARDLACWYDKAFDVFGKMWFDTVKSLPNSYTEEAKNICIKNHGVKSRLFGLRFLIILRFLGYYDFSVYEKYKSYFIYITNLPQFVMLLIAIIPVPRFIAYKLRKIAVFMRQGNL